MPSAFQSSAFEPSAFQAAPFGGALSASLAISALSQGGVGVSGDLGTTISVQQASFAGCSAAVGGVSGQILAEATFSGVHIAAARIEAVLPLISMFFGVRGAAGEVAAPLSVLQADFSSRHGAKGSFTHRIQLDVNILAEAVSFGKLDCKIPFTAAAAVGVVGCSGRIDTHHQIVRGNFNGRFDAPSFSRVAKLRDTCVFFYDSPICVVKRVGT